MTPTSLTVAVREPGNAWSGTNARSIHNTICELVKSKYDFTLETSDDGLIKMPLGSLQMTRLVCKAVGIQLVLRDYSENPRFTEADVMNMFPIAKHSDPRAKDTTKLKVRST